MIGRSNDSQDLLQYPESFGELLGHSIFFYTKKMDEPIQYIAPNYSLKDISKLKRLEYIHLDATGCDYWWIEWGGQYDTIHEAEQIKYDLWGIIYGVWDYIKNSGHYPEAAKLTLEWVGLIPGKRESRRVIGDYMLNQQDLVEQRLHYDAVSYGGWSLDHHPAAGVYSNEYAPCYQWHTKGIYQIPYRIMYSKNVVNLFTAGRLLSTSRAAFGSTRVMMTCAANAQAVGAASVLCRRNKLLPHDISKPEWIGQLQQYLLRDGQFIPHVPSQHPAVNKALQANIVVSSNYSFTGLLGTDTWLQLKYSAALLVPLEKGLLPEFSITVRAQESTECVFRLCVATKVGNYTPEIELEKFSFPLTKGQHKLHCKPKIELLEAQYVFFTIQQNPFLSAQLSDTLLPGIVTVYNRYDEKVAKSAFQNPPSDIGVDAFEFWTPARRPQLEAKNLALQFSKLERVYSDQYLNNGYHRPFIRSNLWLASSDDIRPSITLHWKNSQELKGLLLFFDVDYDFALESVQMHHCDRVAPFCVRSYKVYAHQKKTLLYGCQINYQARSKILLNIKTDTLIIEFAKQEHMPPAVYGVQCF